MSPSYDNDTSSAGASERESDAAFVEIARGVISRMKVTHDSICGFEMVTIRKSAAERLIVLAQEAIRLRSVLAFKEKLNAIARRAASPDAGGGEAAPASWQWRYVYDLTSTSWTGDYCNEGVARTAAEIEAKDYYEVQVRPLYTRPSPAPVDAVAVVERLRESWRSEAQSMGAPQTVPACKAEAADEILAALQHPDECNYERDPINQPGAM